MSINHYICLDGEFRRDNEPRLFTANRVFRFNDAVTENIHASATESQFLDSHIERLTEQMKQLSMQIPLYLNTSNFRKLITDLLNKNRIFGGAHIRLTVFRNNSDEMIPTVNEVSFQIESTPLAHSRYEINDKGLTIGISDYIRPSGRTAQIHRAHMSLFLLAAIEGKNSGLDRVILLNEAGRLTETTDSNLFLVSRNSIFTPSLQQGCIDGIMRKIIVDIATKAGFRVNDQSSLTPSALLDAEEIFLTNAVNGIRWVGAFQQKRYFSKAARLLNGILNRLAFE
jgi:branched-chain amino acid aminotransferase